MKNNIIKYFLNKIKVVVISQYTGTMVYSLGDIFYNGVNSDEIVFRDIKEISLRKISWKICFDNQGLYVRGKNFCGKWKLFYE